MNSFTIRREAEADIPAIRELTSRAFEDKPYSRQREAEIVEKLRDADALTFSFMAVKGASLVGHVAASAVTTSDGAEGWFHIGPISVAPERQGEGIGSLLMQRALDELLDMGAAGAVSVGDPTFLARFDFVEAPTLTLPHIDPQYFRVRALDGRPLPTGTAGYHAAFLD